MDLHKIPSGVNTDWMYMWLATITALWGGVVSYFRRMQMGMKHSWGSIFIHLSVSGFAGLMCWLGCVYMNVPGPLTAFFTGLAGHMGVEFIKIMETKFEYGLRNKLKVPTDAEELKACAAKSDAKGDENDA